jgi:hypothetical protein
LHREKKQDENRSDVSALIQESTAEQNHFQSQMNEVSVLSSNPAATRVDKAKQINKILSDHDRNASTIDVKLTLLTQLHPGSAAASKALCHKITQCEFRPVITAIKTLTMRRRTNRLLLTYAVNNFLEGPDFEAMLTE